MQKTKIPRTKKTKATPTATPAVEQNVPVNQEMPSLNIVHGLFATDKSVVVKPSHEVEDYLKIHKDCYERTVPTDTDPRTLNRVYVDLDGTFDGDQSGFKKLDDDILATLRTTDFCSPFSLMTSSQYNCDGEHKLSYRITMTNICGTRTAIKHHVVDTITPILKESLQALIPVVLDKEPCNATTKLKVDTSVYTNGRKMRMWNTSKPNQNRPFKLASENSVADTFITFIPDECGQLAEPVRASRPAPIRVPTEEESTPSSVGTVDNTLLLQLLSITDTKHVTKYDEFVKIGFICYNEGVGIEPWLEIIRRSPEQKDYHKEAERKHWRSFRRGNLTQALLWKWLREDNPTAFAELSLGRTDFRSLLKNQNHAETARFFYSLKPQDYARSRELGWFQRMPTNVWLHCDTRPDELLYDINTTLKESLTQFTALIDYTDDSAENTTLIKQCMKFGHEIGMSHFVNGVLVFLPACYNNRELPELMDERRNLFAFNDKVVDLDTGDVRDIEPSDYICLTCGYDYPTERNQKAKTELMALLMSIFNTQELVDYVLRVLGYSLHGHKRFEEFHIWTGKGRNGKGVLSDLLMRVFGTPKNNAQRAGYYHPIEIEQLTKKPDRLGGTNSTMALAKGKRMAMSTEPGNESSKNGEVRLMTDIIKLWTGGDPISARQLYHDPVTYKPQFQLCLQANGIPPLTVLDEAFCLRIRVIPFANVFKSDPQLPHERLVNPMLKHIINHNNTWRDEFVRMLIDAYLAIPHDATGLNPPNAVREAGTRYIKENDVIGAWLDKHYVRSDDPNDRRYWIGSTEFRSQYLADERVPENGMSKSVFKNSLERLGLQVVDKSNPFKGEVWNDVTKAWEEQKRGSGAYWIGVRRRNDAD